VATGLAVLQYSREQQQRQVLPGDIGLADRGGLRSIGTSLSKLRVAK